MELILAFLAWIGLIEREKPPPPSPPIVRAPSPMPAAEKVPELRPPPDPLPKARGCREALKEHWDLRVDGRAIWGVAGLASLRRAWGDALIVVEGGNFSNGPFGPDGPFGARGLRNFCFSGTDFTDSDWRGAKTSGVGFIHADFSGAWLDRSRMRGLLLSTVKLDGATALGADWRGGLLQGGPLGSLERVRLDGADLRGFRVDCPDRGDGSCVSSWGSVSLRGADLRGAEVDTLRAEVDWTGARLGATRISLHQLTEIGSARRLGPLIVRAGDVEVRLDPGEFKALESFIQSHREPFAEPGAARPSTLRPGTTSLFVETPVRFDRAFRTSALYRRLVPALAANPISRILVTVRRDGRIDAHGDALGGANHLCDLSGKGLRRNRATGWYSGPHKPWDRDPPEWRNRSMPVLRFRGDWAEAYGDGYDVRDRRMSDYIMCGARAGFGEMIRLPLTSAEARRWSRVQLR